MASSVENSIRVIWGLLIRIVTVVAAVYVLYRVRSILISLIIAVLLTYALLPGVEWICRRRVTWLHPKTQRLLATILVFCFFFAFLGLNIALFVSPFQQEIHDFSANTKAYSRQIHGFIKTASKWYENAVPSDVRDALARLDYPKFNARINNYVERVANITTSSIRFAFELVLIPVLAFYFILDYRSLAREFYGLVPRKRLREVARVGHDVGEILQSYVVGQFILCALAGLLTGAFLFAFRMPYVVVLALFSGITRAIPVIGPVVSGIPIVLVGLLSSGGSLTLAIYLCIFVIFMHFAESKFIMPRLIGHRMHLHPAVVIIVLLVGAEFFGLIGMFLAAPVAAITRDLLRLYYIRPRNRVPKVPPNQPESNVIEIVQ